MAICVLFTIEPSGASNSPSAAADSTTLRPVPSCFRPSPTPLPPPAQAPPLALVANAMVPFPAPPPPAPPATGDAIGKSLPLLLAGFSPTAPAACLIKSDLRVAGVFLCLGAVVLAAMSGLLSFSALHLGHRNSPSGIYKVGRTSVPTVSDTSVYRIHRIASHCISEGHR